MDIWVYGIYGSCQPTNPWSRILPEALFVSSTKGSCLYFQPPCGLGSCRKLFIFPTTPWSRILPQALCFVRSRDVPFQNFNHHGLGSCSLFVFRSDKHVFWDLLSPHGLESCPRCFFVTKRAFWEFQPPRGVGSCRRRFVLSPKRRLHAKLMISCSLYLAEVLFENASPNQKCWI